MKSVLRRLIGLGKCFLDELSEALIAGFQIRATQIHHVPAFISFPTEPILHLPTRIKLPHAVLRIEIITGPIIISGLNQYVQIGILCHG